MNRIPGPQQITWFLDLYNQNRLNLEPPYQRKNVWSLKERQFFLDTIFRNFPCPAIFIQKETDESGNTTYNVVDGKQRLETIFMFSRNELKISKNFGNEKYNGKTLEELDITQKREFWDYIMVVDIVDLSNLDLINEVFDRLNRVSVKLNPQELRHAQFDGWFITQIEKESDDSFWEKVKVSTKVKSKRMYDNQLISELFMVILEKKIVGFDQLHISEIYVKYDDLSILNFDEENFFQEKERIKKYIEEIEDDSNLIKKWASTANNFYSLWSLITLIKESELPPVTEFIQKYDSFMEKVSTMNDKINPDNLTSEQDKQAYTYFANSRGASTDIKQRSERLKILKKEILGVEDS